MIMWKLAIFSIGCRNECGLR